MLTEPYCRRWLNDVHHLLMSQMIFSLVSLSQTYNSTNGNPIHSESPADLQRRLPSDRQ